MTQIDDALYLIRTGEYGYCIETGEEIGVARLNAVPEAYLTPIELEKHEKLRKLHVDGEYTIPRPR